MGSVDNLGGKIMFEASLRGFNKRGAFLAPHLQTEGLYHGF